MLSLPLKNDISKVRTDSKWCVVSDSAGKDAFKKVITLDHIELLAANTTQCRT